MAHERLLFRLFRPGRAGYVEDVGFNALALSNNHAFDLGPSGVLSTLEEVAARDFLHAGIGVDAAHARLPGTRMKAKSFGPIRTCGKVSLPHAISTLRVASSL
jgi:poly-gamma-glutamate capsule biosynthesis protein CapA/YwtB (metallophosphatase superfamily)